MITNVVSDFSSARRSELSPWLVLLLLCSLLLPTAWVRAQDIEEQADYMNAREVLSRTTEQVLEVIDEARAYADDDPERYYAAVHEVLDPVVDFRGFARGVMGDYGTTQRYRSLDDEGRTKLRAQLDSFTETMRVGLVKTYSKGLLAFGGSRVEFDDEGESLDEKRATLRQLIYSDAAEPFVVIYQMALSSEGSWLLRNLVVENVNLGQIYRSQFESSARRFDGDIDQVIANWDAKAKGGA